MTKLQTVWLHLSVALTALTGVVFAWMKYFMTGADEFSVVNHPLQPHLLAIHVVVAPLALFVLGWTFSNHMLPKARFGESKHRWSGFSSMFLIVPMTLSGYLLQVSTNESVRYAMSVAHWVSSGAFVLGYVLHLVVKREGQH